MQVSKFNFIGITKILSIILLAVTLLGFSFSIFTKDTQAVAGINRTINFQGKLVNNPAKTNVSNTSYTVVFTLYDRASGGTALWQETQTVTTADGIFRVALGSNTPFPANFNFNWDGIYLGMKVNADAEMTPRIQMAAVPYAFNSEKVAGLTVQDTSGNASTSGTLQIPNAKTINLGTQNLTFTTSGDTTLTLPTTGTLTTLAGSEILTNKTIGSTGLTFSGGSIDITTVSNEDFNVTPNGSGNVIFASDFDSALTIGTPISSEFPLLVRSGIGNNAALAIDNLNSGNLFTASSSGATRFTIGANGEIGLGLSAGLPNFGASNNCLLSAGSGGSATWGTCAIGTNLWQLNSNVISQGNNTYDVMFGGVSTAAARFAFIGNAGNATPIASISAQNASGQAIYLDSTGSVQTTRRGTLSLGGSTTGNIQFNPGGLTSPSLFLKSNGDIGTGVNNNNPLASFDIRVNTANSGGTVAIASISGSTSFAALVANNSGVGDILAASKSGATKFVIKNDGTLLLDTANYSSCDSFSTDSTALLTCGTAGSSIGDTLLAVYVISAPAGQNLTINFAGAANSAPSSSSGTISFPSNASKMTVEARAGGGGGGGTGGATAIKNAGGGGEGGFSREFIGNIASTYYVKVGAGGNGGAAGGINAGAQGTSTCFGTNASDACSSAMINTAGGLGGAGINSAITAAGGNGGSATGGDLNIQGQSGFASGAVATSNFSGAGGGAGGGRQITVAGADGNSGSSGGGGSGAGGISSSATSRAGGRGGDGYIVFYIYKSGDVGSGGWNQFASGVLAPDNLTTDVLIGGNSTDSAKFGILNVANNSPIASLSAQNVAGNAIYLDAANGILSTVRNQTLTLGGGTSGNVQINPLAAALFSVGTNNPLASNDLRYASGTNIGGTRAVASVSGTTSFAALVSNNSGVGDLFTASKSGATKFSVLNNGNLQFAGTTNFLSTIASVVTAARTFTFPDISGIICISGSNCGGGLGQWNAVGGAISPNNAASLDFLLGSQATTSAKFAVLNVGSVNNTPIASISAQNASGQAIYLDSTGSVQTARRGTLSLGGSTTGNIQFNPGGITNPNLFLRSNGDIGINTINTLASLDVRANTVNSGGTISIASFSGTTSFAGLQVDQRGVGDIFTASTAGVPRFSITNTGGIKLGELQGALGECLKSGGANASVGWGSCGGGGAAGTWTLDSASGTHFAINTTLDTLFGGTSTSSAKLRIASSLTSGLSALIINQTENQDLFTASSSGTPRFALGVNGEIKVGAAGNLSAGSNGQCLISSGNGASVGWGGCTSGGSGQWWQLNSALGTLATGNNTVDLLIGTNNGATASAKFKVTGISSAASNLSVGIGTMATPMGLLNVEGAYTGKALAILNQTGDQDIMVASASGTTRFRLTNSGQIGLNINGNNPLATFDLRANTVNGGTTPVASVSGATSFAALVVNNSGTGNLFTASKGGQTRFTITNNGGVMLGGDYIAASNTARLTNNGSPATINALGDQGSLVPNASFEVATGSGAFSHGTEFAAGWVMAATTSGAIRVDDSTAGHGSRSMKVQFTNSTATMYSACFPVNTADTTSYNIGYLYRVTAAPIPTVRTRLATYTSRDNCNNNTSTGGRIVTAAAATPLTINANWQSYIQSAITTTANTGSWGRVEIFIACTTNCTNMTLFLDGIKMNETALNSSGLDLAENYQGDPDNLAQPGDVVMLKKVEGKTVVVPADRVFDKSVIGVVSTKPGLTLDDDSLEMEPKVAVALAGRIPTKVSTINGEIKVGDELSSSNIPGVAVKAIKSGQIIGVAMEGYNADPSETGKIVMFVKNSYSNNTASTGSMIAKLIPGIEDNTVPTDGEILQYILDNRESLNTTDLNEISIDRLFANFDVITPKLIAKEATIDSILGKDASFSGTLTVDTIRANKIEGLEVIVGKLDFLDSNVASLSSSVDDKARKLLDQLNARQAAIDASKSATESQDNIVMNGWEVLDGTSTLTGDLRVKGGGLFEGILSVIDTIIANNLIANGLSTFLGDVIFKENVAFNNNYGGYAVIKKDSEKVEIDFEKPFEETPIVNVNLYLDSLDEEKEKEIIERNYKYYVKNPTNKGFTIVLTTQAREDLKFSWSAVSITDPKTAEQKDDLQIVSFSP